MHWDVYVVLCRQKTVMNPDTTDLLKVAINRNVHNALIRGSPSVPWESPLTLLPQQPWADSSSPLFHQQPPASPWEGSSSSPLLHQAPASPWMGSSSSSFLRGSDSGRSSPWSDVIGSGSGPETRHETRHTPYSRERAKGKGKGKKEEQLITAKEAITEHYPGKEYGEYTLHAKLLLSLYLVTIGPYVEHSKEARRDARYNIKRLYELASDGALAFARKATLSLIYEQQSYTDYFFN